MERTGKMRRLLKDLRTTLRNCAVIGPTLLAGINFRDWRSTVSHSVTKIAPEITGLVCEQKPYPRPIQYDTWRRKSYSV